MKRLLLSALTSFLIQSTGLWAMNPPENMDEASSPFLASSFDPKEDPGAPSLTKRKKGF